MLFAMRARTREKTVPRVARAGDRSVAHESVRTVPTPHSRDASMKLADGLSRSFAHRGPRAKRACLTCSSVRVTPFRFSAGDTT